ncbi:MAG: extracellular solute-binding protein [Oscillospiraceae bacterium]|nr:extracellular solute-binding protein [Oscillospiraceae bacterium]
MKKTGKVFYQTLAVFLSALLLLSASGCSQDANSPNGGTQTSSAKNSGKSGGLNISLDHSYASEKINIGDNINYFSMVTELNGNLFISGYDDKGQISMYLYRFDDNTTTPIKLEYLSNTDENTESYIMANYINAENQPVFIYHTTIYDETNEEEPYQDLGYTMETYDTDFHLIETKELTDILQEDTYFNSLISDKNGNLYAALYDSDSGMQKICMYDKDFQQTGEISGDISYVQQMFINQEGKIVVSYQDTNWQNKFGFLNLDTKSIDTVDVKNIPQWFNLAFAGKKDYDLFVCDSTSAYGIKLDSGTCEEVINWVNSDFMGDSVSSPLQLTDGRIVLVENDYTSDSAASLWALQPRDPKEFENVQLISLATLWMPPQLGKAVNQFNRTHTDCRIGVMNYDSYSIEEDPQAGLTQFENDMTSGIIADIICMSYMPYERYANKGLLLDLSDYVSQLNPDEYFTNYFDSLKYNDKIYRIGFSYNVQTLEAKTEHVNGKSGLSLAEFNQLTQNLPQGMQAFSEMSKDSALSQLCINNLNNFIDLKTSSCNFNTPEFVQLLELCNSYPADTDNSRENWTEEQWNKYWAEENYQYINNKTLFYETYISDLKNYLQEKVSYFDKADTTFVGYPTNAENSNGGIFHSDYTISVSANSSVKDQIWEFCKTMLSEEAQESLDMALPVRREAFDKAAENALLPNTGFDEEGNEIEVPFTVYRGEEEITPDPFTKADTDRIKSYIESITEYAYYDEQVYNIVNEEAQKYFAGDQSAQAAADMIQSRASLYISEQT